jgi:hypothetical protein
MHRGWALLPLLLLTLASPGAAAQSTLPVTITRFVGLPADSADRILFMQSFRDAMDSDLPCEQRKGDAWSSSGPRRNAFRLVDAAAPDEAWTLELSLGIPPPVRVVRAAPKGSKDTPRARFSDIRASRGLILVASAMSPSAQSNGAEPTPLRFTLYFADARRILVPSFQVPSGGYQYSWTDAGSVVAHAALEALYRARGEMGEDERADLVPATRMEEQP